MADSGVVFVSDENEKEVPRLRSVIDWLGSKGSQWEIVRGDDAALKVFFEEKAKVGRRRVARLAPSREHWLTRRCQGQDVGISRLGVIDTLIEEAGVNWRLELLWGQALHRSIVHRGQGLHLKEKAYILGEGGLLPAAASVAAGLGYRRLVVIGPTEAPHPSETETLRDLYLMSEVESVDAAELTLRPSEASLFINTLDLATYEEAADTLAYFNFMKAGGLVVDASAGGTGSERLSEEVLGAGHRLISSNDISIEKEVLFVSKLGLRHSSPGGGLVAFLERAEEDKS